jgi:hypothetical protein
MQATIRAQAEAEKAQLRAAAESERRAAAGGAQTPSAPRSAVRSRQNCRSCEARYGTDTGALRDALNGSLTEQARLAEAMAAAEEDAAQKGTQLAALEQAMADERNAHAGRLVELEANAATRLADLEIRQHRSRAHAAGARRGA